MMAEHTPGPWEWDDIGYLVRPDGAALFDSTGLATEADHALIAAAPDLLAACEAHGEVADHRRVCQKCGPEHYCWTALALLQRAWQMTEPAIAKARSKQDG